jgi:hypothetical protein
LTALAEKEAEAEAEVEVQEGKCKCQMHLHQNQQPLQQHPLQGLHPRRVWHLNQISA